MIDWHPAAAEELLEMEEEPQKELNRSIKQLPEEGLNWSRVSIVERRSLDHTLHRLKVNPDRDGVGHRALFRARDGGFLILKVGRRPEFYTMENLEQAARRLEG